MSVNGVVDLPALRSLRPDPLGQLRLFQQGTNGAEAPEGAGEFGAVCIALLQDQERAGQGGVGDLDGDFLAAVLEDEVWAHAFMQERMWVHCAAQCQQCGGFKGDRVKGESFCGFKYKRAVAVVAFGHGLFLLIQFVRSIILPLLAELADDVFRRKIEIDLGGGEAD